MLRLNLILIFVILAGCGTVRTPEYRQFYSHLGENPLRYPPMPESCWFVIFLVDARHLDYSNIGTFCETMAKNGNKNNCVGHTWVYLQGMHEGKHIVVECGLSGERGLACPRYAQGVLDYVECGDPNPIRYLWEPLNDGFRQRGSGRHMPTYAAKVDLTEEQFWQIYSFIHCYDYSQYALTGPQCTTFVAQIASQAGLELDSEVTMCVPEVCNIRSECYRLWSDPCYSEITFATPDVLERSLMCAVAQHEADYALIWYLRKKGYSTDLLLPALGCRLQDPWREGHCQRTARCR